jgi:rod shape-determining protein MreD
VIVVRTATVVLSALVLQASILADVRVDGVAIDLLLIVAIAAGLAGGPSRGGVVGFACGLGIDLLLLTPLGLSALAYSLTGYLVGSLHDLTLRAARWVWVLIALVAAPVGIMLFVLAGELVGVPLLDTVEPPLWLNAVVNAVAAAILVLPARRLLRWALAGPTDSRPALTSTRLT